MRNKKGQFIKGTVPMNKYLTAIVCCGCGDIFQPRVRDSKYCSQKCYLKSKGFKKGMVSWNKGISWTKEDRFKMSKNRVGIASNTGRTHFKKGIIPWNYKGGITKQNKLIRGSPEYKLWRIGVFKRDYWSCVLCGHKSNKRGDINADHIKPFALFPELRLDINNGRTLCEDCHRKTLSYKNNNIEREDFLNV